MSSLFSNAKEKEERQTVTSHFNRFLYQIKHHKIFDNDNQSDKHETYEK